MLDHTDLHSEAFNATSSTANALITTHTLVLSPGRFIELNSTPGEILKNSNTSVVKTQDLGSKVILYGKKKGLSQLHLGQRRYSVIVTTPDNHNLYELLDAQIKNFLGLSLNIERQQLIVRGHLYRWSDWVRLSKIAAASNEKFHFEAEINPIVRQSAEAELNKILDQHSLPPVAWSWSAPPVAFLPHAQKNILSAVETALGPFGIKVQLREDQLLIEPSIEVEVLIAEVSSRFDQKFGLRWGQEGQFTLLPQDQLQTSLQATLDALENRGLGRVLATPKLLCRSGHKAEFHSGGEFPVTVITPGGQQFAMQNVIWKKHGMILEFEPRADRLGRLQIKLMAELSMLTDFEAGEGIPGLIVNRIQSSFDLESPRTIALSGLIREDWHKGHQALPFIHQIPILGSIFKSQNFINKKSELVVFVTPRWVKEDRQQTQLPPSWNNNDF